MFASMYMDITLDTLILASVTLSSLSVKLAYFTLATLVSLHYNIYKDRLKLTTFKIGQWQKLVLMNTFCV